MRPLETSVSTPQEHIHINVPASLKRNLVEFAYAEQSTLTAVAIEAFENFLADKAHILSERHRRKQEQVEMLLREERQRQRAERESAEFETKFGADASPAAGEPNESA